MRISDWSSDVCSSDLDLHLAARGGAAARHQLRHLRRLPGLRRGQGHGAELRLPELRTACRDDGTTLSRELRRPGGPDDEIGKHPSELQSLMRPSYAVFCLNK